MLNDFQNAARKLDELQQDRAAIAQTLSKKVVKYADPDGLVTVTADLRGTVRSITFANAGHMDSRRLADKIGVAINGARSRARTTMQEVEKRLLPAEAAPSGLWEMLDPGRPIDFNRIEYDGPVEARNRIAECMERMQRMMSASEAFADEIVREKIGRGVGTVTMTAASDRVALELDTDAIRSVGPDGLGEQIVAAMRRIEITAVRRRVELLQRARTLGTR